jgi:hypothetical protein
MAESKVEIANSALIKLGAQTIMSFDDMTKEARLIKTRYTPCLKACLRNHIWNFAIKRVTLSPLLTTPSFEFTYEFQLPSDFVRIYEINDQEYRIENGKILANTNVLELRYVYHCDEPMLYDSLFSEMFATYIAWDLSYALTQSNTVRSEMWGAHTELLRQARSVNAKEEVHDVVTANLFDESRLSSGVNRANR